MRHSTDPQFQLQLPQHPHSWWHPTFVSTPLRHLFPLWQDSHLPLLGLHLHKLCLPFSVWCQRLVDLIPFSTLLSGMAHSYFEFRILDFRIARLAGYCGDSQIEWVLQHALLPTLVPLPFPNLWSRFGIFFLTTAIDKLKSAPICPTFLTLSTDL